MNFVLTGLLDYYFVQIEVLGCNFVQIEYFDCCSVVTGCFVETVAVPVDSAPIDFGHNYVDYFADFHSAGYFGLKFVQDDRNHKKLNFTSKVIQESFKNDSERFLDLENFRHSLD